MTFFDKKLEHTNLQLLLQDSYNEGESPHMINSKFTNTNQDNWFYILILILILIIVYNRMSKKQIVENDRDIYVKKKKEKYATPHEYYTNAPRIK